jgi:acyl-CoA thioester hydrolase
MKPDQEPQHDTVSVAFRVRYFETDQMQVAHHAHYPVWFEVARAEFCRVRGIDYAEMERDGYYMPIIEVHCRYRSPARYDEALVVSIRVLERTRRTIRMGYKIWRGETRIAEGETLQAVSGKDGKSRVFPDHIAALFDGTSQEGDSA